MLSIDKLTNMPIIDCGLFIMRPIELNDVKDIFEYGSSKEVVKFMPWGPYRELSEVEQSMDNVFLKRPKNGLPVAYAIVYKENNKMIGTCDFHSFDQFNNSGEIGYCLNQNYWNKGIMTKAVKELIKVGFEYLNLSRIQVMHDVNNKASQSVIEKCDFRKEGLLRKNKIIKGKYINCLIYSIISEEYFNKELSWQ